MFPEIILHSEVTVNSITFPKANFQLDPKHEKVNPSNAEATFIQSTRTQRSLKII